MKTVYFISPHLDDAFFSAGALMMKLIDNHTKVVVVNVFNKAGDTPETFSAKTFLKQIGVKSSKQLYSERVKEDQAVLSSLGVKVINLDQIEALWRKKNVLNIFEKIGSKVLPELMHIYPVYRLHIINGHISSKDQSQIKIITDKVSALVLPTDIIVCPLGIGGHIDHLVVRAACEQLHNPLVYWADIPYKDREGQVQTQPPKTVVKHILKLKDDLLILKDKIARGYKTQYKPVFGEQACANSNEEFYSDTKTLTELFKNI